MTVQLLKRREVQRLSCRVAVTGRREMKCAPRVFGRTGKGRRGATVHSPYDVRHGSIYDCFADDVVTEGNRPGACRKQAGIDATVNCLDQRFFDRTSDRRNQFRGLERAEHGGGDEDGSRLVRKWGEPKI